MAPGGKAGSLRRLRLSTLLVHTEGMATATSPCNDQGPRVGSEGVVYCAEHPGHYTDHRADPSWGDVRWLNRSADGQVYNATEKLRRVLAEALASVEQGQRVALDMHPCAVLDETDADHIRDDLTGARQALAQALGRVESILLPR